MPYLFGANRERFLVARFVFFFFIPFRNGISVGLIRFLLLLILQNCLFEILPKATNVSNRLRTVYILFKLLLG